MMDKRTTAVRRLDFASMDVTVAVEVSLGQEGELVASTLTAGM